MRRDEGTAVARTPSQLCDINYCVHQQIPNQTFYATNFNITANKLVRLVRFITTSWALSKKNWHIEEVESVLSSSQSDSYLFRVRWAVGLLPRFIFILMDWNHVHVEVSNGICAAAFPHEWFLTVREGSLGDTRPNVEERHVLLCHNVTFHTTCCWTTPPLWPLL